MAKITGNSFGKGGSAGKSASPDGLTTMNKQGAPKGVNPNKGYPSSANTSGDRGGMPGSSMAGTGGPARGARSAAGVHMGAPGSGHVASESKRSSMPGYTPGVVAPGNMAPGDLKVKTYGKKC